MYEKHARPTYTITPILHVRKSRPAYMHLDPNSACTQNTPGLQKKNRKTDQKWNQGYGRVEPRRTAPRPVPA